MSARFPAFRTTSPGTESLALLSQTTLCRSKIKYGRAEVAEKRIGSQNRVALKRKERGSVTYVVRKSGLMTDPQEPSSGSNAMTRFNQPRLAASQRRAHDPLYPARRRRFQTPTTQPAQQHSAHLLRAALDLGHLGDQPVSRIGLVSDRTFSEPEELADLRAATLARPACPVAGRPRPCRP